MRRRERRLVAVVLLAGWVFPLGLPALCRQVPADVGCEQSMPPAPAADGGALLAAASHHLPCANPAFCGVPVTAVPTMVPALLAATSVELAALFEVTPLDPGASRAPLPPPPQA